MEGKTFTLLPDFPVRPILCDNNLSALAPDYQRHIIGRYKAEGVPLEDANSGFEPGRSMMRSMRAGARSIAALGASPIDDMAERSYVERVMQMLKSEPAKKKRVYTLIGNEPMEACLGRIYEVIAWGGEPHAQPYMKLNALQKKPHVRFDWSRQDLTDMARWCNGHVWRKCKFEDYRRSLKTASRTPDEGDGMFATAAE